MQNISDIIKYYHNILFVENLLLTCDRVDATLQFFFNSLKQQNVLQAGSEHIFRKDEEVLYQ